MSSSSAITPYTFHSPDPMFDPKQVSDVLMTAAENGDAEMIHKRAKLFHPLRADKNDAMYALAVAAGNGHIEVLLAIWHHCIPEEQRKSVFNTTLIVAAKAGRMDEVRALLGVEPAPPIDPDRIVPLLFDICESYYAIAQVICSYGECNRNLDEGSRGGFALLSNLLAEEGALTTHNIPSLFIETALQMALKLKRWSAAYHILGGSWNIPLNLVRRSYEALNEWGGYRVNIEEEIRLRQGQENHQPVVVKRASLCATSI